MSRIAGAALGAALLALAPSAPAQGASPGESIHQIEMNAYPSAPAIAPSRVIPSPNGRQAAITANRDVVGYFPYWISDTSLIPYSSLTRLSWFGVSTSSTGAITNSHGWGGAGVQSIVDTAHSYGIQVLLTVTLFDGNAICSLVNSSSRRQVFIDGMLSLIEEGNGDGISVDFEFPQASCMGNFEVLIQELSARFGPLGLHVDIATPPIDWSYDFDYGYLSQVADSLFIMGYNYHWPGGNPGSVDPLYGGGAWGPYSLEYTVEDYLAQAGANRDKIIMGVPTYAIEWPTTSQAVPGTSSGTGDPLWWSQAHSEAATYGRQWESINRSPYYTYASGGQNYQTFYQDVTSMEERFAYAESQNLGGVGFWALGYDGGDSALWAAVDAYSGGGAVGPVGDLVGYVREGDIFEGAPIPGARVSLGSGESTQTDAEGFYRFDGVEATVTYTVRATAECYEANSEEKYVEAGITNWRSIALTPQETCGDPPTGCNGAMVSLADAAAPSGAAAPLGFLTLLGLGLALRRRS